MIRKRRLPLYGKALVIAGLVIAWRLLPYYGAYLPTGAASLATFGAKPEYVSWISRFNDPLTEFTDNIDVDRDGNIYVAGLRRGLHQIALRKYSDDGKLIWARAEPSEFTLLSTVVVDQENNNLYAVGVRARPRPYRVDLQISKYTLEGKPVWTRVFDAGEAILPFNAAIAPDGTIYVVGSVSTARNFDDAEDADVYVGKFDRRGTAIWAGRFGGAGRDVAFGVTVDRAGHAFVAGDAGNDNFLGIESSGDGNGFIVKYEPSGTVEWATHFGKLYTPKDIAIDADENLVVIGRVSEGSFVARFDPAGGRQWTRLWGGTASQVVVDLAKNIHVIGERNWVDEGATRQINVKAFVHKYSPDGTRRAIREFIDGRVKGAAIDRQGNLFVYGSVRRKSSIGSMFLTRLATDQSP